MKKIYNKVIAWLNSIGTDKYLHFIAGLIIAALFNITLGMTACIVPVFFAAFIKEFVDGWRYGGADWRDAVATLAGGAVIQLLAVL